VVAAPPVERTGTVTAPAPPADTVTVTVNDGSLGDVIGNGFVQGPVTVLIREDDGYFETSGCDDWVRAG
jgi:hypothetical protein